MTKMDQLPDPLQHSPWLTLVPALTEGQHMPLLHKLATLREAGQPIFPPQHCLFRALDLTPPHNVRVIILGQDPYHGAGQAHGLAFSVPQPLPCPRSLTNIFKEIHKDLNLPATTSHKDMNTDLTRWAQQGVLLLNTILSVEEGKPLSHASLGWQRITEAVLKAVAAGPRPVAVLLWGKAAQGFASLFLPQTNYSMQQGTSSHLVLTAAHPSPLSASRGFYGCAHFSKVNAWLRQRGEAEIRW